MLFVDSLSLDTLIRFNVIVSPVAPHIVSRQYS